MLGTHEAASGVVAITASIREISQRGTITVGKRADLVILDGDLSALPGVIRSVRLVFKDGIGYDAPKLRLSAKALVGIQ